MSSGFALSTPNGAFQNWFAQTTRPTVIVLGNEKGGSGKSTTAMHLIVGLMERGHSVGSIDLDSRQATLTHYVQNRVRYASRHDPALRLPEHQRIEMQQRAGPEAGRDQVLRDLAEAIEGMQDRDYIVIDTPGSETFLSHLGHIIADTLVTPLNDSFLDLDVLVRLDADGRNILGPSNYARMVLARASRRRDLGGPEPEWIVMRTRRAHLESRNRRDLEMLLEQLGQRIGFRLAPGLSERVVYRELFTRGLTVLDVDDDATASSRNAARSEVAALVDMVISSIPTA